MLNNLKNALRSKNITNADYARFLGVTEKTIANKLNGTTPFTYPEVINTKKFLFQEYDLEYLFATDTKVG